LNGSPGRVEVVKGDIFGDARKVASRRGGVINVITAVAAAFVGDPKAAGGVIYIFNGANTKGEFQGRI
jgi:hypothetical protein